MAEALRGGYRLTESMTGGASLYRGDTFICTGPTAEVESIAALLAFRDAMTPEKLAMLQAVLSSQIEGTWPEYHRNLLAEITTSVERLSQS